MISETNAQTNFVSLESNNVYSTHTHTQRKHKKKKHTNIYVYKNM